MNLRIIPAMAASKIEVFDNEVFDNAQIRGIAICDPARNQKTYDEALANENKR
jgi:hypothetical protein